MYSDKSDSLSSTMVEAMENYEIRSDTLCYIAILRVEFDRYKSIVAKYIAFIDQSI